MLALILFVMVMLPGIALAQQTSQDVILLEGSLPGIGGTVKQGELGQYLNNVFKLGIGVASGLAVIYITVGGVQYMIGASAGQKEKGREKITGAVGGLLLALGAFVILNTINPDLLEFKIVEAIQSAVARVEKTRSPVSEDTGTLWLYQLGEQAREQLKIATGDRVRVNKQECKLVGEEGCTSLVLISPRIFDPLKGIVADADCDLIINGGTEYWLHGNRNATPELNPTNHKPYNAVIDLDADSACLDPWIIKNGGFEEPIPQSAQELGCPASGFAVVTAKGFKFQWEPRGCGGSTGDHWHIEF